MTQLSKGEQIDEAAISILPMYRRLEVLAAQAKARPARRPINNRAVDKALQHHAKRCHRELVRLAAAVDGTAVNPEHYRNPSPAVKETIREIEAAVGVHLQNDPI